MSFDSNRRCYPVGSKTLESQNLSPTARKRNRRPGKPASLYRTRGFLLSHPAPSSQKKSSVTNDLSSKGCRDLNGLGKSGSPNSKMRRRRSSASFGTPNPPRIPSARPTPLRTSMGFCTMETRCGQRHPGAAPRCHHQTLSQRTSLSIPSAKSWITWCPLQPTKRLF